MTKDHAVIYFVAQIMRFLPLLFLAISLCYPNTADAAVYLDNSMLKNNLLMKRIRGPYYIVDKLHLPKGVKMRAEPGTEIIFQSGGIFSEGNIDIEGTETLPVRITQDRESSGFLVLNGGFHADFLSMTGGQSSIQAYSSSTVVLRNFSLSNVTSDTFPIAAWQKSVLDIQDGVFTDIKAPTAISVFNGSGLLMNTVYFNQAGISSSVSVYNSIATDFGPVQSVAHIETASFESNGSTRDGVDVFNDAFAEISSSTFSGFGEAGLSSYANANVSVSQSIFSKNKNGVVSYGANVTVSDSEFSENAEHGALHVGGAFEASGNWWGDSSGPYDAGRNQGGKGDQFSGEGTISPWLTEKKRKPCCSNILFIPGIEGSRIYKRQVFSENQLWEPNDNADVKKLFLDKNGQSIDKTLYVRDIIKRTNITFGGAFDREIYYGFANALNGLVQSFSIRDWEYAAYDWRMSPNTVVAAGARTSILLPSGKDAYEYQAMTDQILRLAKTSKTGKVSLIAHSYGGVVAKRLLSYLADRGMTRFVDKVTFVAVPEAGSPSSLFALLHGDNQDIGRGFVLSRQTARTFAQNMPSIYALLPATDDRFISGQGMTVSSVNDMKKFLFDQYSPTERQAFARPASSKPDELNVPAVGNKAVSDRVDLEKMLFKNQADPSFGSIKFYNILGIGIETVKSITYKKSECVSVYGTITLGQSKYCGLDHDSNYSKIGDGTVLLGDLQQRWGDKFIFDIGNYNTETAENYSHGNIMSAPPVISLIMQVETDNLGYSQIPKYVRRYTVGASGANSASSIGSPLAYAGVDQPTYQVLASESLSISAVDRNGNTYGAFAYANPHQSQLGLSSTPTSFSSTFIPITNDSPNSSYGMSGGSVYVLSEAVPRKIYLTPVVDAESPTSGVSEVNISMRKLMPEIVHEGVAATSSSDRQVEEIFSFSHVPITEYSHLEMNIDLSSAAPASLIVRDDIGGVYSEVNTYAPDIVTWQASTTPGSSGNLPGIISPSGVPAATFQEVVDSIRLALNKSSIRPSFRSRYLLRLSAIEKYGIQSASGVPGSVSRARTAVDGLLASLQAILKELGRARPIFYTGGMSRGEAVFLLSQFSKLARFNGD